jgi:hypothetical protein
MIVVPKACGVTMFETTDATLGSDEVKVHQAAEVDDGGFKVRLLTLSFVIEISPKGPRTGAIASIVNFIDA